MSVNEDNFSLLFIFVLFLGLLAFAFAPSGDEARAAKVKAREKHKEEVKKIGYGGILKKKWKGEDVLEREKKDKEAKKKKGAIRRAKDYLFGVKGKNKESEKK